MHSIRTILIMLICFLVIGMYVVLTGNSMYYLDDIIEINSRETMDSLAKEKAMELNTHFEGVERAVGVLGNYIKDTVDKEKDSHEKLKIDRAYSDSFLKDIRTRLEESSKVLGNVATVYFRMNPNEYSSTSGLFLTEDGYGDYISTVPTDILKYDENDREHVGWYYEPVESGHALWMSPYVNRNINVYMISYVAPIYVEGRLFGVIGMDIKMSGIHNVVDSVDFNGGTGFLADDRGNLVYHKDFPNGLKAVKFNDELREVGKYLTNEQAESGDIIKIKWNGVRHRMALANLSNGMILAISVPYSELIRPIEGMRKNLIAISIIVALMLIIIIWRIQVRIVNPIRGLTIASSRIAKGEMNVPIEYYSKDEIGILAGSIRSMRKELQQYFSYIHKQAYMDVMTGVGNKTAYFELIHLMDRKINEGMADFAIAIFDINGLKNINDNFGHETGDLFITDAADALKRVFGAEHIYRIGGDEFIIVLEHINKEVIAEYFIWYEAALAEINSEERPYKTTLSVSKGYAFYDPEQDKEYKQVFKRADASMYKDKEAYYKGRNDRRKR